MKMIHKLAGHKRRKEKVLGVSDGKRAYDLPLKQNNGNNFLILLIGLMTFLAVIMTAASFTLSALGERWSSGLEDRFTIEIPVENSSGHILPKSKIQENINNVITVLSHYPAVETVEALSEQEISELISPWIGEDAGIIDNLPLPGLISVRMKTGKESEIDILRGKIKIAVPHARIDTHETWLNDVLRFTKTLRFATMLLSFFVGLTVIIAIAGAIRSRMAEYHAEIELLHLMGASDRYISKQFQRHTLLLAIKGGCFGLITAFGAMVAINLVAGQTIDLLLPEFKMSWNHYAMLCALPLLVGTLAITTTQKTVKLVLEKLP